MSQDQKEDDAVRKPLYDARGDNTKRIVKTLEWVDEMRILQRWDLVLDGLDMIASMIQSYISGYKKIRRKLDRAEKEYESLTTSGFSSDQRWFSCKHRIKEVYREIHEKAKPFLLPDSGEEDSGTLGFEEFMEGSS